jgi:hypothetical protein
MLDEGICGFEIEIFSTILPSSRTIWNKREKREKEV